MAHRAPVKGLRQRKEDRTRAPSTLIPTKHTRQIILFDGLLDSSILQNDLVAISGIGMAIFKYLKLTSYVRRPKKGITDS